MIESDAGNDRSGDEGAPTLRPAEVAEGMNESDYLAIITVGTGRNRKDIASGICYSLRHHGARRAVFLCSSKTQKETLPEVRSLLGWSDERVVVHVCRNEEDVQGLFLEWLACWDSWTKGSGGEQNVIVDFTSGTKAMSAAAVMLAAARGARVLSYVTGNRDESGRVMESSGVQAVEPSQIVAHHELRLAVEHFEKGNFAAARRLAEPYAKRDALPEKRLAAIAKSIHLIAAAYDEWDRFDYRQAADFLRRLKQQQDEWPWVRGRERLKGNHEIIDLSYEAAKTAEINPAIVADLLANADRCLHRAKWDDAVVRMYRACEMLSQLRLWQQYKQRTNDIKVTALPEGIRPKWEAKVINDPNTIRPRKLKIGLELGYELIGDLNHGDPLAKAFAEFGGSYDVKGELHALLGARNHSLLGHGETPIDEKRAKRLREVLGELALAAEPAIASDWLPKTQLVTFERF